MERENKLNLDPKRPGAAARSQSILPHLDFSEVAPISRFTVPRGKRYDYSSPSLKRANLLGLFPSLEERDPASITWPYLRKDAPHLWRSDKRCLRHPDTGVQSFEEAELLYNNALQFVGRRGLEIGCHYGWSTAHLLAAGLRIDVIDPALGYADQMADVRESLAGVPTAGSFNLWAGFSPSIVPAVRSTRPEPWSFVFIDGYHEGRAPLDDAEAVSSLCAPDACVMFHDLVSPHVAAGIGHFVRQGWNVGLYNTMQVMAIAWRGAAAPVRHIADPKVPPPDSPHLAGIAVLSV
jgi:Methyltransferase domain